MCLTSLALMSTATGRVAVRTAGFLAGFSHTEIVARARTGAKVLDKKKEINTLSCCPLKKGSADNVTQWPMGLLDPHNSHGPWAQWVPSAPVRLMGPHGPHKPYGPHGHRVSP